MVAQTLFPLPLLLPVSGLRGSRLVEVTDTNDSADRPEVTELTVAQTFHPLPFLLSVSVEVD